MMVHALIPALVRLRQENLTFEASLGYVARPCFYLKKEKKNPKKLTPQKSKQANENKYLP
jgi:hypothetical protein